LMRTFFESIPKEMEESAKIDGANDIRILFTIYIPTSVPAIATLTMFYLVERWNRFLWPSLLVSDPDLMPLQVLLRRLIVQTQHIAREADAGLTDMSEQTIIYAAIVLSVVPLICLYPLIQRFFIKGLLVGAIKG